MATITLRNCRKCGPKPEGNFGLGSNKKPKNICRACAAEEAKEWREKNPGRFRAAIKRWQQANRHKTRAYARIYRKRYPERFKKAERRRTIKRKYGLSFDQFDQMAAQQDGKCAICRECPSKVLRIDHDHKTKRVRGLLCDKCNQALGLFNDNVESLRTAIAYLLGVKP